MVGFVILHFQALEETITCVESILNNVIGEKKIVIVDNDSPNHSGEELKKIYHENLTVDVIITKKNNGFAMGNNIGFRYMKKVAEIDYIIVMNNDMEIEQNDFIEKIKLINSETDFDILGPDIFSAKYKYHQNPQADKNFTYKELKSKQRLLLIKKIAKPLYYIRWNLLGSLIKPKHLDFSKKKFIQETTYNKPLHGSFYVFSKRFINNHDECFDEGTFMYLESYILFYHATRSNEKVVYDPRIKVIHYEDVATDQVVSNNYKKAIFSNDNLLASTNYFINLMKENS